MAYWLCITNSENWSIIRKENVWGVSDRHVNTLKKVKEGDQVAFYGIQEKKEDKIIEPRIYGIFEATSEVYRESKRIFKSKEGEIYPNRIKVKPVKIPSNPVEFKPLIPKLRFITNKNKWNTHLFGRAMRELPEEDFRTIEKALK